MTRELIEKDIFEKVKVDYEAFVSELKTNNNYDFFKSLDSFAQRIAFLNSSYSYGIDFYRDRVYANIYGYSYRITKSFTFENYENAVKSGYYYTVDIDKYIKENPIFAFADDKTRELILAKTVFKDFKNTIFYGNFIPVKIFNNIHNSFLDFVYGKIKAIF